MSGADPGLGQRTRKCQRLASGNYRPNLAAFELESVDGSIEPHGQIEWICLKF